MKHLLIVLILTLLTSTASVGYTEAEATLIVVNDLRMDLQQSEAWSTWDLMWLEWFTVRDLYPFTGFF